MMLGEEEGMEYEVCVDGTWLDRASEFKYLEFILYESGTDDAEWEESCGLYQVPG